MLTIKRRELYNYTFVLRNRKSTNWSKHASHIKVSYIQK